MLNSPHMTDLERTMQREDAELVRREAEIQGMNGALEIDGDLLFVHLAEPSLNERLTPRPKAVPYASA
jgi:hypothetical protein